MLAFILFTWWFLRGAAFRPEEYDRVMLSSIFGISGLCALTVWLVGLEITDRPGDRNSK